MKHFLKMTYEMTSYRVDEAASWQLDHFHFSTPLAPEAVDDLGLVNISLPAPVDVEEWRIKNFFCRHWFFSTMSLSFHHWHQTFSNWPSPESQLLKKSSNPSLRQSMVD
jgi:hypothetical protein